MCDRYRKLQAALLICLVIHIAAPVAMLLLVMPGFDLGGATVAERAVYIATSPWLWRMGWLPWQLCALSDLWVSVSLLRWVASRSTRCGVRWAWFGVLATVAAVIPEQRAEAFLVTEHVEAARVLVSGGGEASSYLASEAWALLMTGTCGNDGYVLMTIAWACTIRACASKVGGTSGAMRSFRIITALVCILFLASGQAAWTASRQPGAFPMIEWTAPLSGAGFLLLDLWFVLAAILVGRVQDDAYPATDAEVHALRWSRPGRVGRFLAWFVNEPGVKDWVRFLPFLTMRSDVEDVVFLSWLVPHERVERWLPAPLKLARFGGLTPVSILSYSHRHFGPAILGPFRRFLPSPKQSNWRLYLDPDHGDTPAIYFVKTALGSAVHVAGARLMSNGLPAHLPEKLDHWREGSRVCTQILPGDGSAPDLDAVVREREGRQLPSAFGEHFGSWEVAVSYLVEQGGARFTMPRYGEVLDSRIDIPIDVASVRPCEVECCDSSWLRDVVGEAVPFAFVVPKVAFRAFGDAPLLRSRARLRPGISDAR